jgi:hypothetical protein
LGLEEGANFGVGLGVVLLNDPGTCTAEMMFVKCLKVTLMVSAL